MADLAPNGLLDEHAPRDASVKSGDAASTYDPTPEEKKVIKLVEKLFEKAKKHRAQYDQKWLDYYHMFRGKQWKEQRPSYRHSEVINLIFRTLQSLIPIQVDSRPRFEFLPQDPSDYELSLILNDVAEADWTKNNWSEQLLEVIYDANFYGTGMSRVVAKPVMNILRVVYESADPFYCFPDPDARDTNKDCAYFVYAEPMDVRKIKKRYPEVKDYIKPDIQDLLKGSKTDFQPMKFRSPIDNKVTLEGSSTMDLVDKDKALLITLWLSPEYCEDDFEETEEKTIDPETKEEKVEYTQKSKYPNGRKIVVCNGVLCEDEPNGYDDSEVPYERYPNYILPREFWGMSEVEQLEGPQKTFNKLVSFALDVLTLMGNPIWVVPTASGVDAENITNRPGLVLEPDGTRENHPYRVEGVQLQPYVLQMIEKMGEWFDTVGGSQDVTRGVQPTGVTAASAISTLQEAAQTRVRQKSRNLDGYLQHVGQHWVSRTFQFRTAPEIYRLTNMEGASKYFRMHVEQFDELHPAGHPLQGQPTGETKYRVNYQPVGETGQIDPTQAQVYETRGKFDVKVATGSALPFAKDELENKLLAYFDRGIIDQEEVLKRSDYPNYQAVIARIQQKAQADAAAQAQQQGAGGNAPPPAA